MDILDLIASDNYIPYNRTLAKQIGVENSIIFGALCGYQRHYKQQEFFREQQHIMEDTCLTEYSVRKSIKELKELGLINVVKKGLPAKYYFQINTTSLINMLSTSGYENYTTGDKEIITTTDIEIENTNNKNINNKNDNKNNIKHIYGTYKHIRLTDSELNKLKEQYSNWQELIDYLDEAIEMKGYKYKSHYLAIKKWVVDAVNKKNGNKEKSMWDKMSEVFDE